MQIVGRALLELWHQVQVELLRLGRLSVYQQATAADVLRQPRQPGEHILEQSRAESASLMAGINGKPGQQRRRLRVTARSLPQSLRRGTHRQLRHAPRVISHHDPAVRARDDEHPGRPGSRGLAGMTPQPVALLPRPALETRHVMIPGQQLRRPVTTAQLTNGDRRSIRRRNPGRSLAGRAFIASHASAATASSSNRSRSASTR